MKTLLFHVSSLLAGGIEKVLIELLQGLDPEKYKIHLSIAHSLGELEVLRSQVPPYVEVHYILDSKLSATKKKKVTKTITLPEKLYEELILPPLKRRLHRQKLAALIKDTDIIIDFDMTLAPYTQLLQHKVKVAYCHFSLGHYWDGNTRKLDKLARRLQLYDKVVMLCEEMKDKAVELYPALKDNVVRIYNALDTTRINALAQEPVTGYDLPADGYFVSAGRLAESQKDFTMLIKGYAACVRKYGIRQQLAIIGEGYSRNALEALALQEGVQERVTFAGFQANPYKWMHSSQLFLFCSKYEGLPTVLIEALSLACPIIATATPTGVQEILMYGKCGTLIPPGDTEALCEAIYTLAGNKAMQAAYHENAQAILPQFQIKNMVLEFERLIIQQA